MIFPVFPGFLSHARRRFASDALGSQIASSKSNTSFAFERAARLSKRLVPSCIASRCTKTMSKPPSRNRSGVIQSCPSVSRNTTRYAIAVFAVEIPPAGFMPIFFPVA